MYAYPEPLKPPKKEEKEKVQFSEGWRNAHWLEIFRLSFLKNENARCFEGLDICLDATPLH